MEFSKERTLRQSRHYTRADPIKANLVKLDIRINGDVMDAMSMIVHRDRAYQRGRDLVRRMRELIDFNRS